MMMILLMIMVMDRYYIYDNDSDFCNNKYDHYNKYYHFPKYTIVCTLDINDIIMILIIYYIVYSQDLLQSMI